MNCEEAKLDLPEYLSHSLTEAEELEFSGHIATCAACRAETERLGSLWKGLALLPGMMPAPGDQVRERFYESLAAYRHGMASARPGWKERLAAFWPAVAFAMLAVGVGIGYLARPAAQVNGSEVAQLRGEVSSMRQMVALSLMQQQSAGERLRGVSWAYRAAPSDTEVLSALLETVNNDASVNVRMAAVDALHTFGSSPVTRTAIVQSIAKQTSPLVQIGLIDLLVDLKASEMAPELKKLAVDASLDAGVRERAAWAIGRLMQ
jgi:anti-sigma factor RsiW